MPRPRGIIETKPRKPRPRKLIEPGLASWKRLWTGGHYASKGLSLELFRELASQPCHYCGDAPRRTNAYGLTYNHYIGVQGRKNKMCTEGWWNEQWIYANGVDKVVPTNDYRDLSNLVPCCKTCNFMKGVLGQAEFLRQVEKISSYTNGRVSSSHSV